MRAYPLTQLMEIRRNFYDEYPSASKVINELVSKLHNRVMSYAKNAFYPRSAMIGRRIFDQ